MARTKKDLLPMDLLIAGYLRDGIDDAGLTYRQIAAATGMSINRIGIILRKDPPPATVGEIGMLASQISQTASGLTARAESELIGQTSVDNVGGVGEDTDPHEIDLSKGDYDLAATHDRTGIKEQIQPDYENESQDTENGD